VVCRRYKFYHFTTNFTYSLYPYLKQWPIEQNTHAALLCRFLSRIKAPTNIIPINIAPIKKERTMKYGNSGVSGEGVGFGLLVEVGLGEGVSVGEADGLGEGLGVADGDGELGEAEGDGEGLGVGDGGCVRVTVVTDCMEASPATVADAAKYVTVAVNLP
jgi:hypothetical protein